MQPTNIEWARSPDGTNGFSWNPIRGLCKINCSYCYAKAIYKRFKLNPTVLFNLKELHKPSQRKKPAGIFCCSTHELFGEWVLHSWREMRFEEIEKSLAPIRALVSAEQSHLHRYLAQRHPVALHPGCNQPRVGARQAR